MNAEQERLLANHHKHAPWKRWGPYLAERQWGTVREDYSPDGDAWRFFPHQHAAARAYRWGEDGLGGLCDHDQQLCLGLALWNGADAILKERLFGLTNQQGNHGEDVKELYYYLDATPTSSWLRMLYKYPQRDFPYARLFEENSRRDRHSCEFELLDSGIFDDNRYFDVFIEYAKNDPEDILWQVVIHNRGPEPATLHVLLQAWFRDIWSWKPDQVRPLMQALPRNDGLRAISLEHPGIGARYLAFDGDAQLLFCDNETNAARLFDAPATPGYFKDAFHDRVIYNREYAVNPAHHGTKSAAWHRLLIQPGASVTLRARLSPNPNAILSDFDILWQRRQQEADQFFGHLQAQISDPEERHIQRQALAGMLWSKQWYYFDVPQWLKGDPGLPVPPPNRRNGRNSDWRHLNNADVISMPDKWEYPWYAAWDLAFHTLPLAMVDADFAKEQLLLLTREWYMHPNGQLPAYEWDFGDVNPPVHAWATWRVFQIDRKQRGDKGDLAFLERVFHKLLLNFTWWVNRKDARGRNVFQGGFLGMDNIGVFDRNTTLPGGVRLDQADATSWMAMFSLNLLRISLELAVHNPVYQDIATKFFEHFLEIAEAMTNLGGRQSGIGLWDENSQFYYDHLTLPNGTIIPLDVRTMVGLVPLFAVEVIEPETLTALPEFEKRLTWYLDYRPEMAKLVSRWREPGRGERRLLSLLRGSRMKQLLKRMLDETEFLSPYGVRSLSAAHRDDPYQVKLGDRELSVRYLPGESDSGMFGGNSNWRGPIWFPVNYLIVESLERFHHYYGDDFRVECPTGSGQFLTLKAIAQELSLRLTRLFRRGPDGCRPAFGPCDKQQRDPHFRDHLLFHEYFHGDHGQGLGASHQTGWTGLIAMLLDPNRSIC
jgi:hypothetical protein